MGLFTKFKPMQSWSVNELAEESIKLASEGVACYYRGPKYDVIKKKQNELDVEFVRRGISQIDAINRKLSGLS